jgi:hypothetical protein
VSDTRPLLHIGFHKTGTTWLQQHLFCEADAGFAEVGSEIEIKRFVVKPHDLDFRPGKCRGFFVERIAAATARGLVPVISAERLCGDMLFGAPDSAQLADRLYRSFPEARVLIVVREQRRMLFSHYHQYVKMGGRLELERYLHKPKSPHPWPCDLRHFEYDRLIAYYRTLFGESEVLVLPYELFRSEPERFATLLAGFAGAAAEPGILAALPFTAVENRSWPAAAIAGKRHLNRFIRDRLSPAARIDSHGRLGRTMTSVLVRGARRAPAALDRRIEGRMRRTIEEMVGDRYRASNGRTSELTGFDLAGYGYDVASAAGGEERARPRARVG